MDIHVVHDLTSGGLVQKKQKFKREFTHEDYLVGWICPLEVEQIAASYMLDEEHKRLSQPPSDHNNYTLGSIHGHNVVLASMPDSGNCTAATVATQMRSTFPNMRFGLLVGIGGGVPVKTNRGPVRLGHVVVSKPTGQNSGAIQYDHGKAMQGRFIRTGIIPPPPAVLLNAATRAAVERAKLEEDPLLLNVQRIDTSRRQTRVFRKPSADRDQLFRSDYKHRDQEKSCRRCGCDKAKLVQRDESDSEDEGSADPDGIEVHRGTIASGENVMRDAERRDQIATQEKILCFEMEAAGALNDFPCLVVRGISDYSDSHKNDVWQGYAAAVAAAYARDLFNYLPIEEVQQLRVAREIISAVDDSLKPVIEYQEHQKREKICNWLSPIDFETQLKDKESSRCPGTGQWFLDEPSYKAWKEGNIRSLLCPGIPGAGKSILASIIVRDLFEWRPSQDKTIGIAYYFFNYKRQDEQTLQNIVMGLLKQLCQMMMQVPEALSKIYDKHTQFKEVPDFKKVVDAFHAVMSCFSRVYIVLDALDEFPDKTSYGKKLSTFIVEACDLNVHLQILTTSRPTSAMLDVFRDNLNNIHEINIRARESDVRTYLSMRLTDVQCARDEEELQKEILNKISEVSDGMFLFAILHIESLKYCISVSALRQKLGQIPHGSGAIEFAYAETLRRIEMQHTDYRTLAQSVLQWVVFARRPLSISELSLAVSWQPGDEQIDYTRFSPPNLLVSVCCGLIKVQEENELVVPSHKTVSEYFQSQNLGWRMEAETKLATLCLNYTLSNVFLEPREDDFIFRLKTGSLPSPQGRLKKSFGSYVATHGFDHARESQLTVENLLLDVLQNDLAVKEMAVIHRHPGLPTAATTFQIIAHYGLDRAVEKYLYTNPGAIEQLTSSIHSHAPLTLAAAQGHIATTRLIFDLQISDKSNTIKREAIIIEALKKSIIHRKLAVYEILVQYSHDKVELREVFEYTRPDATFMSSELLCRPEMGNGSDLIRASKDGLPQFVKLLLDYGAISRSTKSDLNLTLMNISYCPNKLAPMNDLGNNEKFRLSSKEAESLKKIIKTLLEAGVEVDHRDSSGRSALTLAAMSGVAGIVQPLIDNGANVNVQDHFLRSPLLLAAERGASDVIRLLVAKGADVNARDIHGRIVLLLSIKHGASGTVRVLLDNGAHADVRDQFGMSALMLAAKYAPYEIVQLLLDRGANVNAQHHDGRKPLAFAEGREEIQRLLRINGAKPLPTRIKRAPDYCFQPFPTGRQATALVSLRKSQD